MAISASADVAVLVRQFREEDLASCQRLAGSALDWTHIVDLDATHLEVAELDGEVIGFAYVQVWNWNRVAWLGDILVDENWRDRGVGTALLDE